MRFPYLKISTTVLLLCLFLTMRHVHAAPKDSNRDPKVESAVKTMLQRFSVPGAAVLIYRNGTLEEYVFGYSDLKKKIPVTTKTLFELGSVTKTFTGLLLAQEVLANKVRFGDELKTFQPPDIRYSPSIEPITLLELATHTASVPKDIKGLSYNAADTNQNRKNLTHFLQTWTAPHVPGTHALYSNLSYSLLGMTLATQQDKSVSKLMQQNIFVPLKMNDATLSISKGDENYGRYAQGYNAEGKPARTPAGGLLASSWALKASLEDMAGYLKAAVGDPKTPSALLAAMRMAQTGYVEIATESSAAQTGLGWQIIPFDKLLKSDFNAPPARKPTPRPVTKIVGPQFNGHSLIDKSGATNGFRAYIGVIPDQQIGVVILTNKFTYHGGAVRDLGRKLLINLTPSAAQFQ